MSYENLTVERRGNIYILTMQKPPENRITVPFAQTLIRAFRDVERALGPDTEGAVILRGNDTKFFCTGLDLDEREKNPFASTDGFYPLLHTILDFPFPTICLITGHVFGGACLLTMAHDYRIMNSSRGYWSMPPANLGLHFDGMGALLRSKLSPQVARKVLLQAHKFTGKEALKDGIVDEVAAPEEMLEKALEYAEKWKAKAKMGVYGVLRSELYGEAVEGFKKISYVHSREVSRQPKVKL
ncbi:hypothetical protein FQN55_002046 [Onygenales sp. PD_40]|nr:hypothetical protein FQN55_002046 [Onygenales sp. PD_40]KAK2792277.1 hypothetical protein FQN52_003754 [Onygenales sp. PD_12]KAK2800596.1 hypothetical protein FQN51_005979 [Onygenales sp. PD_10]